MRLVRFCRIQDRAGQGTIDKKGFLSTVRVVRLAPRGLPPPGGMIAPCYYRQLSIGVDEALVSRAFDLIDSERSGTLNFEQLAVRLENEFIRPKVPLAGQPSAEAADAERDQQAQTAAPPPAAKVAQLRRRLAALDRTALQIFRKNDVNYDGRVTAPQLHRVLGLLCPGFSEAEAAALLGVARAQHEQEQSDGSRGAPQPLTYRDFIRYLSEPENPIDQPRSGSFAPFVRPGSARGAPSGGGSDTGEDLGQSRRTMSAGPRPADPAPFTFGQTLSLSAWANSVRADGETVSRPVPRAALASSDDSHLLHLVRGRRGRGSRRVGIWRPLPRTSSADGARARVVSFPHPRPLPIRPANHRCPCPRCLRSPSQGWALGLDPTAAGHQPHHQAARGDRRLLCLPVLRPGRWGQGDAGRGPRRPAPAAACRQRAQAGSRGEGRGAQGQGPDRGRRQGPGQVGGWERGGDPAAADLCYLCAL